MAKGKEVGTVVTPSLYSTMQTLEHIEDLLLEAGGELTPEVEAHMEWSEELVQDTVERAIRSYHQLLFFADAYKREISRLEDLARTRIKAADSLKYLVGKLLQKHGVKKVDTEAGTATRVKNSQPSVMIESEQDVPIEYYRGYLPLHKPQGDPRTPTEYLRDIASALIRASGADRTLLRDEWKRIYKAALDLMTDKEYRKLLKEFGEVMTKEEAAERLADRQMPPGVSATYGHHVRIK